MRAAFAHFRGEAFTPEPGSLPFRDRRRVVILNLLPGAEGYEVREILYNDVPQDSGALSARDEAMIKAAINSVQPGVSLPDNDGDGDPDESDPDDDNDGLRDVDEIALGLDPFASDSDANGIPDNLEDPDRDGYTNEQEVNLLLTDPLRSASRFQPSFTMKEGSLSLSFPTLVGRRYVVQSSPRGEVFEDLDVIEGTGNVESLGLDTGAEVSLYRVRIEQVP